MEIVTTDELDHQLIHALRLDPRIPFARFAALAGVSEQTVARRFRRLRENGVVRVVGLADSYASGHGNWMVRIRARPGAAVALADALAQRPDVRWVSLTSGGAEILCAVRSPAGHGAADGQEMLLHRLPHTREVMDFAAQMVLHRFEERLGSVGDLAELDPRQVAVIREGALMPVGQGAPAGITGITGMAGMAGMAARTPAIGAADEPLMAELRVDGRAPVARLAQVTGWGPGRVQRRLEELVHSGLVYLDAEMALEALGFVTHATIWLTVAPADLHRVGRELAEHREIAYVAAISGSRNLMGTVTTRGPGDLYRYVTQRLGSIPGVQQLEIAPILRRLKQNGSIMRDGRLLTPVG